MGRILSLIKKEFLVLFQDRKSRNILIIAPLVQLFIFAFAATLDVKNVTLGVLNQDSGKFSYELIQRFQGSPFFTKVIYLESIAQMKEAIDNQKIMAALQFDEQFSRNVQALQPAKIGLFLDGRKSNTTQIVQGYAARIVAQYASDLSQEYNGPALTTELIPRNWFNPNLIYSWFNVPGLVALLTMVTALVVTSLSVARERELGTFDQLLVSPLLPLDILIGKTFPGIIVGMVEGTIILLAAVFFFRVPFTGSVLALYGSMFLFVSSIVGTGLLISSFCKTQQQAFLLGFFFLVPSVTLSGFATPIDNMPSWLQMATYLNPLRYFLIIVRGIFLKEMPLTLVLDNAYPLAVIAAINLTAAFFFFRKRLE